MMTHFDALETRSALQREADLAVALPAQIARAQVLDGYAETLTDVDAAKVTARGALAELPILRKSDLGRAQAKAAPFGGYTTKPTHGFSHVFQSPGPIYEPSSTDPDWWRMGRFLHGLGIGEGDIVQIPRSLKKCLG